LKIYLLKQNQYRFIVTSQLCKFRRKKSSSQEQDFTKNNQVDANDQPKPTVEQILNHQWLQIFERTPTRSLSSRRGTRKTNH